MQAAKAVKNLASMTAIIGSILIVSWVGLALLGY
jgi:hypothetical protein